LYRLKRRKEKEPVFHLLGKKRGVLAKLESYFLLELLGKGRSCLCARGGREKGGLGESGEGLYLLGNKAKKEAASLAPTSGGGGRKEFIDARGVSSLRLSMSRRGREFFPSLEGGGGGKVRPLRAGKGGKRISFHCPRGVFFFLSRWKGEKGKEMRLLTGWCIFFQGKKNRLCLLGEKEREKTALAGGCGTRSGVLVLNCVHIEEDARGIGDFRARWRERRKGRGGGLSLRFPRIKVPKTLVSARFKASVSPFGKREKEASLFRGIKGVCMPIRVAWGDYLPFAGETEKREELQPTREVSWKTFTIRYLRKRQKGQGAHCFVVIWGKKKKKREKIGMEKPSPWSAREENKTRVLLIYRSSLSSREGGKASLGRKGTGLLQNDAESYSVHGGRISG